MPEQKALYLTEKFGTFAIGTAPVYNPGPGELLIKVQSAALNPADWVVQAHGVIVEEYPVILGIDVAGIVAKVGEGVTRFKEGDRVCVYAVHNDMVLTSVSYSLTPAHIGRSDHAGFQQYMLTDDYSSAEVRIACRHLTGCTLTTLLDPGGNVF